MDFPAARTAAEIGRFVQFLGRFVLNRQQLETDAQSGRFFD